MTKITPSIYPISLHAKNWAKHLISLLILHLHELIANIIILKLRKQRLREMKPGCLMIKCISGRQTQTWAQVSGTPKVWCRNTVMSISLELLCLVPSSPHSESPTSPSCSICGTFSLTPERSLGSSETPTLSSLVITLQEALFSVACTLELQREQLIYFGIVLKCFCYHHCLYLLIQ